jgi:hypothetical protein
MGLIHIRDQGGVCVGGEFYMSILKESSPSDSTRRYTVRKKFSLLLVLLLLACVVGLAQTSVEPRAVGVLLFDNETGGTITKLVVMFDKAVTFEAADIIVFGGGAVTTVTVSEVVFPSGAGSYSLVKIEVEVVAGGTLQVMLSGDNAGAQVVNAYWF